mgnify:CR=1 FL=1
MVTYTTPKGLIAELRRQAGLPHATWPCVLLKHLMPLCDEYERLASEAAQPKWRPMSDAPKDSTTVLLLLGNDVVASGYLGPSGGYRLYQFGEASYWSDSILGWMPMPPAIEASTQHAQETPSCLFGTNWSGAIEKVPFFTGAIDLDAARDTVAMIGQELWHGPVAFALHGFLTPVFWLTVAGFALATAMYWWRPELATKARETFRLPVKVLENKYWADDLWIKGFAGGSLGLGRISRWIDEKIIDGLIVNGAVRVVGLVAAVSRRAQSGLLYHYAFVMIIGLVLLLAVLIRHWR